MPKRSVLILVGGLFLLLEMGIALVLRSVNVPWGIILGILATTMVVFPLTVGMSLLGPWLQRRQGPWSIHSPRTAAMAWAGVGLGMWLLSALVLTFTGGSYLVKLVAASQHMAFFLAAALATYGVRREGSERHCRQCGYEMSPAIAEEPGTDHCPECGALWKRPHGTVVGRRRVRWPWLAAAAAVVLLLMGWPFVSMSRPGLRRAPLRLMPTASLVAEASTGSIIGADDAWIVLRGRTMTRGQEVQLARNLLDQRRANRYTGAAQRDWLLMMQSTGKLPAELSERYLAEHPYPALIPGDRARLGLPAGPTSVGP